mmetsp:Transcript_45885/g.102893  ORF Transcript_45885/g.102893 Transcript_45885/m.102893 type:complete len:555 (+) Transcript_45885:44-1708(+)
MWPRAASKGSQASIEFNVSLDPELRRGVPLHEALSACGKHWKTPDSGMFSVYPKTYRLSRRTEAYDAFLSHDWASSRILKFVSLLIVFNSRAAFFTSLVISIIVGFLRAYGILPNQIWTVAFGHAAYFVVFFFWQRLRAFLCGPLMVFLDKLCIAQHDEGLKLKGIFSLPGFLLSSKRLVVLWSPRYFSRLWCTFEIATFLKDPNNKRRIEFMPLKTSGILVLTSATWHLIRLVYTFGLESQDQIGDIDFSPQLLFFMIGLMSALGWLLIPPLNYLGLGLMHDLEELPRQLRDFRVQEANCFCCSNDHRHPYTGDQLACDRRRIFRTLQKWYGGGSQRGDNWDQSYLESFNARVVNELAPSLVEGMGGSMLPLRYTIYVVGACNLPYVSNFIPGLIHELQSTALDAETFRLCFLMFMNWMVFGLVSVFATRVGLILWKSGLLMQQHWQSRHWGPCSKLLVSFVLVPPMSFAIASVWLPYHAVSLLTGHRSWFPILPFFLVLAATVLVFGPCSSHRVALRSVQKSEALHEESAHGHLPVTHGHGEEMEESYICEV